MGEPSQKAWSIARYLCGEHAGGAADTAEVAQVLQGLMDIARDWELRAGSRSQEIDDLSRELTAEIEAHRVARDALATWVRQAPALEARAEQAETRVGELEHESLLVETRRENAVKWAKELEASKAELIREVQEWGQDLDFATRPGLEAILGKHREGP